MSIVNIFEAKSSLSRLIERIESGAEAEIIIARHGRPVAKLIRVSTQTPERRIGIAKGRFEVPDSIDTHNEEVAHLFLEDEGS
jgi:antitoxin (DNA-binding transcriptional repressor) of toxin-antitoxin stability system